jgi:hypothetical protein
MVGDHLIISDISVIKKSFSKTSRGPPKMIKIWLSNAKLRIRWKMQKLSSFSTTRTFSNFEKHYFMGFHDSRL